MALSIVAAAERPDLAPLTGRWRWEAFFSDGSASLAEILQGDADCAASRELHAEGLRAAGGGRPGRQDRAAPGRSRGLAGLYVDSAHRGRGFALRLIGALEDFARKAGIERLSLYTPNAEGLYAKAGWRLLEHFEREGERYAILRKTL